MKESLTPNIDLFKHKSIDIHYKKHDKSTIGAKNRLLFNNSSILKVEPDKTCPILSKQVSING